MDVAAALGSLGCGSDFDGAEEVECDEGEEAEEAGDGWIIASFALKHTTTASSDRGEI